MCRLSLPSGFDEGESAFQRWCDVLLLDAMQRSGWFKQTGDSATATEIAHRMPGAGKQLLHDLLQILEDASFLRKEDNR